MVEKFPNISTWNYRLVRKTHNENGGIYYSFTIHEVYYEDGKPIMISTEPESLISYHDVEDLKDGYQLMGEAFSKPTLIYEDIINEKPNTDTTTQTD